MSKLKQQINLYQQPKAKLQVSLSLASLLIFFVTGLALIGGVSGYVAWQYQELEAQHAQVALEGQSLQDQLAVQKSKLNAKADPYLIQELNRLRKDRKSVDVLVATIKTQGKTQKIPYSKYLQGLARNPVEGLWLERITVAASDDVMLLQGSTDNAATVPRLLDLLSKEPAYKGLTFSDVEFQGNQEKGTHSTRFELKTRSATEALNAG